MLFYAVTAFALLAGGADLPMVVLAWAFVLTRLVHAAIHIGPNKVQVARPGVRARLSDRRSDVGQAVPARPDARGSAV